MVQRSHSDRCLWPSARKSRLLPIGPHEAICRHHWQLSLPHYGHCMLSVLRFTWHSHQVLWRILCIRGNHFPDSDFYCGFSSIDSFGHRLSDELLCPKYCDLDEWLCHFGLDFWQFDIQCSLSGEEPKQAKHDSECHEELCSKKTKTRNMLQSRLFVLRPVQPVTRTSCGGYSGLARCYLQHHAHPKRNVRSFLGGSIHGASSGAVL